MRSMGQEEWASLQHGLQLLAAHFLSDELSVFVLLNFVTSMYALGAFITKVCKSPGLDAAFVCWPYLPYSQHIGPCVLSQTSNRGAQRSFCMS